MEKHLRKNRLSGWKEWFRGLAALIKDQGPLPTCWLTTNCNLSSRGSSALFWPPRVPGTHVVPRHTPRHLLYVSNET